MSSHLPALVFFRLLMAWSTLEACVSTQRASRIALLTIGAWIAVAISSGMDLGDMVSHLGCGLFVLSVGFGLFCVGWMASADAKLLAAIAVWLGWPQLAALTVGTLAIGFGLHLVLMAWRTRPLPESWSANRLLSELHGRSAIPFGLAAGLTAAVLYADAPLRLGNLLGT